MKIRFIQHESILPRHLHTRYNYVAIRFHQTWAGWCTWNCGLKRVEEIVIVRQRNLLKTTRVFIHELAHAVAYVTFGVRNWHEQLIQRYL